MLLSDAVDAPHALLEPHWVPRHVVVDHEVAELEIDAFTSSLGRDTYLRVTLKLDLPQLALLWAQTTVDRITPPIPPPPLGG